MRKMVGMAALVLVASACAPTSPGPETPAQTRGSAPATSTTQSTPAVLQDAAQPYTPPAQPPQRSEPLEIWPSRDAHDRLSKVFAGKLVDSADFHAGSWSPDGPMSDDDYRLSFMTPSGGIICSGAPASLICGTTSATLPRPPRPVDGPSGNWVPYVSFDGALTYGLAAGNPMVPLKANVLPYGSTLRFGDTECLSAEDGITCANIPASTGFHLSRDDLTPMRSVDRLSPDTRVEPRTPGSRYCGVSVPQSALDGAMKSLPDNNIRHWVDNGTGDSFSCHDLQIFQVNATDTGGKDLPAVLTQLLVFDRGRFVGTLTDSPYVWMRGQVDDVDATLVNVSFLVLKDGKQSTAHARARYEDGTINLLDPVPQGAIPAP